MIGQDRDRYIKNAEKRLDRLVAKIEKSLDKLETEINEIDANYVRPDNVVFAYPWSD